METIKTVLRYVVVVDERVHGSMRSPIERTNNAPYIEPARCLPVPKGHVKYEDLADPLKFWPFVNDLGRLSSLLQGAGSVPFSLKELTINL